MENVKKCLADFHQTVGASKPLVNLVMYLVMFSNHITQVLKMAILIFLQQHIQGEVKVIIQNLSW